jgi:ribosomal RNA-processing protein 12
MEGLEMEYESEDFCNSILSKFSKSTNEHHHHLCAVIGAMSQELKDQKLPLTPVAYFGATCSSLDRISGEAEPSAYVIDSLLTILSMILPRVSVAVLKKKVQYVSDLVVRAIKFNSINAVAATAGLKCISHLLVIREKSAWSDVSQLYGVLLSYATDERPKVRKQASLCIRDVLQSFHGTPLLSPACEAITNIFAKSLLLAGGSDTSSQEGSKGAQKVLYLLDFLKDNLPYISIKFSTNILKYFKSPLLELNQSIVTRHITDCLNLLCLHPNGEVSAEVLLDLLCSLALIISSNETSADNMTVTARLLDVGMKKVYSLNREICVAKLPVIFSSLADILASEHEEPLLVVVTTFKNLIDICIDESLIKQGQIGGMSNSVPTTIEKICATVESLLDYRYAAVWDMSFLVTSAMFDKLGQHSYHFLKSTLSSLAEMQNLPDEDFSYRKQLHECVGSALIAMGPERFLSILPLKLDAQDLSEANVWLFPILKQYTIGSRLSFFTTSIMAMIRLVKQKSAMFEREGKLHSARSVEGLVYSLWSLLPSFCNYPSDTAESFKNLEKELICTLRNGDEIRGIICSSLQILIQQNKRIVEGIDDFSAGEVSCRQRALVCYTKEFASKNLSVLRNSARSLLPVLSELYVKSTKDDGGSLQNVISEFASISDKDVVTKLFMTKMKKLLELTKKAAGETKDSRNSSAMQIDSSSDSGPSLSQERAQLFDLAASLLPGLNAQQVDVLFVAIKPALKDQDGLLQKKSYKVLSIMLKNSDEFLSRKLDELLNYMIEVLPLCHFSAKRHRLTCLYYLCLHVYKKASEQQKVDVVVSFLTEIVLALKESNKKTRNKAYDILVQIGHAFDDEENGGTNEKLQQFFNMVARGMAGETPHMISAAVKGLARLAYEFTDLVSSAFNVLPSAYLLLRRKNREIIKANLGLLKVLVAKSQSDGLQLHLKSMVEGLLVWQDNTKNHFKAKVKLLLEMLVKKCGMDAVKAVMPEEHMKLLTNIRKLKERKEKKLGGNTIETKSHLTKATTSRLSRWNHTKIFSDFDDDEEAGNSDADYMDMKTNTGRRGKDPSLVNSKAALRQKRKRKAASLAEDSYDQIDDEPLDLLDRQKTRSSLRSSSENSKRKSDSDNEDYEIDPEGRMIIHETSSKKHKKPSDTNDSDARSETASRYSANSSRKGQEKRRKTESNKGWSYTGSEYGSKKASGDLKRKDKLEPYAYWPLDRKMVSRRPEQRAAARKGMASVVRLTKNLEGKSVSHALSYNKSKKSGKKKSGGKKNR